MKNIKKIVDNAVYSLVALVVIVGFIALTGYLIINAVPEGNKDMVRDIVTTLRDALMLIVGYFYGSSKSSAEKNEMLYKSTPAETTA